MGCCGLLLSLRSPRTPFLGRELAQPAVLVIDIGHPHGTSIWIALPNGRIVQTLILVAKPRNWSNERDKPTGLKTICFDGSLGGDTPDVVVFDTLNHEIIRTMIESWREVQYEAHPGVDLAETLRAQGMKMS